MSYLKVLIVLTYFLCTSNPEEILGLDTLRRICAIDCGKKEIPELPTTFECTAIAKYETREKDVPEEEIQSLRKEIPYLYLFDKRNLFEFSSWVKENIDSASFEILRIMIQKKIQIAVLDPHPHNDKKADDVVVSNDFMNNTQELFKRLKDRAKNEVSLLKPVLFGLGISGRPEIIAKIYDPRSMESVDFFIVRSMYYKDCTWNRKQEDMANTAPIKKMKTAIESMTKAGFLMNKTVLTIEVVANSIKRPFAGLENWSYKYYCESKPGKMRKFCLENLDSYLDKARIIYDEHMAGVIVKAVDRDDHANTCQCDKNPALTVIRAGMEGKPKPDASNCKTWAITKNG